MKVGVSVIVGAALLIGAAPAAAAVVNVSSDANEGPGSLRAAIEAANPGDLVQIEAGVNPVLSAEIAVDKTLDIRGIGASTTTIDGGDLTRIFSVGTVQPEIDVIVEGLTLTGGHAPDGAAGANETGTEPGEEAEPGGDGTHGGAILSAADNLELREVLLEGNRAGNGGGGGEAPDISGVSGAGGAGGDGGAVYNQAGSLVVYRSTLVGNEAGDGGHAGLGPGSFVTAGDGGDGGAIASEGGLTVIESTLAANSAGQGGPLATGAFGTPVLASEGGSGGAVVNDGSTFLVEASTFAANKAGQGGSGAPQGGFPPGPRPGGRGGDGGAIFAAAGENSIENSTFFENAAGKGGTGTPAAPFGTGGAGGPGGDGGAIAAGGVSGALAYAVTAVANAAGAPGAGGLASPIGGGAGSPGPEGSGGAFAQLTTGEIGVHASIAASNVGVEANCTAGVEDAGDNLAFPEASGCSGFAEGDPKLDAAGLADNGGPTETVALEAGSAALDLVPVEDCLTVSQAPLEFDQRGEPRPDGPACDAGAYEGLKAEPEPEPEPEVPGGAGGGGGPAQGGPAAGPAPVIGPPGTRWQRRPKSRIVVRKGKASVKLRFLSPQSGATFQCKLGRARYRPCRSPKTYLLKPGRHTVKVRAMLSGVPDPTPLSASIQVVRVEPKPVGR
jgi:hypothetical protein